MSPSADFALAVIVPAAVLAVPGSAMSTSSMMPAESALASSPPVGHMPHPPSPGDGPTQLSSKHPNVVNYAISAGGVVLGVALITTFALICRWRRRRRQRALDDQIDERIREKTLSRLEANRTHSLLKLPAAALASEQSVLRPLPRLGGVHLSNSSKETLPRPRQACCTRSSDQRLPCDCPDCVVFARSSTLAPSRSGPAVAAAAGSTHGTGTLRHSPAHRQPRSVRGLRNPLPPGLRAFSLGSGSSVSRFERHTDENTHRAASVRTPSPRVASPYDYYTATFDRSAPTTVGMGIMVATHTSALGHSPPMLTTPSLGFSTPRASGSPALALSDDAGATTINPIAILEHERDPAHEGSLAAATSNSTIKAAQSQSQSVDVAASRGHLASSLAHMQVSPLIEDRDAASGGIGIGSPVSAISVYASAHSSPEAPGIQQSLAGVAPGELPFSPRADGEVGKQPQGWFAEMDWFGSDGPSACHV